MWFLSWINSRSNFFFHFVLFGMLSTHLNAKIWKNNFKSKGRILAARACLSKGRGKGTARALAHQLYTSCYCFETKIIVPKISSFNENLNDWSLKVRLTVGCCKRTWVRCSVRCRFASTVPLARWWINCK